ncbi:MAG: YHYH protein, partial [Gimesia sp.]
IIKDDWKLFQPVNGNPELYNLRSDISETNNLASKQPTIVYHLVSELAQFKQLVARDLPVKEIRKSRVKKEKTQEGEVLAIADCKGDSVYGVLGDQRVESNGRGLRLLSGEDLNQDKIHSGEVTIIQKVNPDHRWYRLYISGLAQDGFSVEKDALYLKVEFFQKNGTDSLDLIKTRIYSQVERERKDFKDDGTNKNLGLATWRTYAMDFRTPFAEIDTLKLSVGFNGGIGKKQHSEFWVRSIQIKPIDTPKSYAPPIVKSREFPQPALDSLIHLGGRWYFDPKGKTRSLPKQFDHTNSDQLLYLSDRLEAPFAENMTSWLRGGYLNFAGDTVKNDQYVPDNLVITVTKDHIVMHSKNLPNHPTASFPDRWRLLDGNPAYIKEQKLSWHIPINPQVNRKHIAMNAKNENGGLPMGAIGVATNGIIFFNPFDHIFETDAVWRLDRCCGHPSPQNQYHYHKYPVCIKTPWSDQGLSHSNVIGFAFDGFPVYGPYESKGVLAKNDSKNPLNKFNLHEDAARGPHYHVTPGKFPHIIGGYWGKLEELNRPKRRRRPQ